MIPLRNRVTYMNAEGINFDTAEWFYEYWEPAFLSSTGLDLSRNAFKVEIAM